MNSEKNVNDSLEIEKNTFLLKTINKNVQSEELREGEPNKLKENEQFILETNNKQEFATKEALHPEKPPLSQNSSESTELINGANVDKVRSKIVGINTNFVDDNNNNPEIIEKPVETTSFNNTHADEITTLLRIHKSIDMNNNSRNKLTTLTPFSNNIELNNINDAEETSETHTFVKNEELINESNDKLCNSSENLIMNLDTQEWLNISELNLDEFENIVYDLKLDNSPGIYDFEEPIQQYIIEKHDNVDQSVSMTPQDSKENTYLTKSYEVIDDLKIEYTPNNEESKDDVLYLSSDEETDLKLNWSFDDLDTVPLNIIKALCDDEAICFASETILMDDAAEIDEKEEQNNLENRKAIMEQEAKKSNRQKFRNSENLTENDKKKSKSASKKKNVKINLNKDVAKTDYDIETISVSSNDSDSSDCSGYQSTDFEFITETEAASDGLIVNFEKSEKNFDENTCRTIEVSTDSSLNGSNNSFHSFEEFVEMAGPSRPASQDIKNLEILEAFEVDDSYRQNHEIPQGEQYLDLFQGICAPLTPCFYENKSMEPLMTMEYEGLGFDMRAMSRKITLKADDKYKKEADDIAKKILNMYPEENRKRRRRH